MKYDRETGNLLQYDPEDGQLDSRSRDILRCPETVKALIHNSMILPGGWLTPEAKKQCEKLESKIRKRQIKRSTGLNKRFKADAPEKLKPVDLATLKHYHPKNGKLDLKDSSIINDAGTIKRLVDNKLILPDGTLTPAVLKKFGKINSDKNKLQPDSQNTEKTKKKQRKAKEAATRPGKLTTADWAILMKYDRETGNLLQYNPEDGRPDRRSRDILRHPETVKPLIDNNMILPGGWLTPEAKKQCEKLELKIRKRQIERSTRSNTISNKDARPQRSKFYEVMKHMDLAALSKYDREINHPKKRETSEDAATSLRDILHVIFKRKMHILIFFFAVFITAAIGTLLAKPVYEASSQILVKMGRESVFVPAGGDMSPVINFNREERINSEIEILKSSSLAEKVVLAMGPTVLYESLKEQKPGIFDRIKAYLLPENGKKLTPGERKALKLKIATSIFQDSLTIESVPDSNIVQVNFEHPEPRLVAMAVNNLADIYLDRHLEVHKTAQSHNFFQEQTELLKNKLEQSEVDLKEFKKQHNITSLEQERTLMLGQLSELRSDLDETSSQIVETEKRISQLKRQLGITPRTIAQGEDIDLNQQVINTLQTRLVELELREKDLSAKYTDQSRLVQNIKKEIQMVRNRLAEQEKKQYGRKRTGANPTYQRLQGDFYRNEAELSALKAKESNQNVQLANYQAKLEVLNKIEVKLDQLKQQVEVDRENYRLYLSKYEESRISNAMDNERISSVSLLEPARQPLEPVKPKKMLNLLLAVFVGAFGGIGLAFFMEYLDDKLEKVEDVEECLHLPVLASIPELTPKEQTKTRMGKILHNALNKYSNGYRQRQAEVETKYGTFAKTRPPVPNVTKTDLEWYEDIKTKIAAHYPGESIKTLMFTGTKHGGGVTMTAINFAKTLVLEEKLKVLLMDVNLRTPHFKDFFNINHERGISELILDGDTKVFKILKIGQSQLYIVATGSNNVRPVDLFRSEPFNRFLKKAHTYFDYVILDAAPIPSFAESRVLCEKVDGVVLVVESGDVRKQVALRAKKELEEAGARVLGAVLNKREFPIPRWIYNRL